MFQFTAPHDMLHFEPRGDIKNNCLSHIESLKFKRFYGSAEEIEVVCYLLGEASHLRTVEFDFRDYVPKTRAQGIMADFAKSIFKKLPHVVHKYYIAGQDF